MSAPDLTSFKALSFDCYGTLIDWEGGLAADLAPILSQLPEGHAWRAEPLLAVERFDTLSNELEEAQPAQSYDENLSASFVAVADEAGATASPADAAAVGAGPGRWPAFSDTVDGLRRLARHYRLIILSNVNEANIRGTVAGALGGARFDAVYTAEAIGSYKPSHANFRYLFAGAQREFGVDWERGELLHVAHSLTADHVPAKELGLPSVWISRGARDGRWGVGGNQRELSAQSKVAFGWQFETMADMADEADRQFAAKAEAK
ncbi:HAD-like domain-containing protein [Lasiosphaeria miniovina]|uniref:HAD-like domain-containing protein n=1 Tax=Lasiosphaeria miniovina TaxID=1954250 RepID=A0AA40ECC9_9PEZI|nr:HAD-like domain-containing protein [Lasiosphaeria miniovina]KAK0734795.1 HAD-like domain-containing protein [Lasiosphaeria miniovina]